MRIDLIGCYYMLVDVNIIGSIFDTVIVWCVGQRLQWGARRANLTLPKLVIDVWCPSLILGECHEYIYIYMFPLILNIEKPSKTMVLRYARITHLGPKQWGCYDSGWDVIHEPQRLW